MSNETIIIFVFCADLENLTLTSFEPILPEDQTRIVSEGSLFQQTCLQPNSLPSARQWWLNSAGHTVIFIKFSVYFEELIYITNSLSYRSLIRDPHE